MKQYKHSTTSMLNFHQYILSINEDDENLFGLLFSPLPILYDPLREIDKISWSNFFFKYNGVVSLPWVQKRKLQQITSKLLSSISSDFQSKEFFLIPAKSNSIDIEFATSETDALISYVSKLSDSSINLLEIYKMPEHPNEFVEGDPNHHSQETYTDVRNLSLLKENITSEVDLNQLFENKYKFNPDSIFPIDTTTNSFTLLKFISYFRYFLKSLPNLYKLSKQFSFNDSFFPYLIESFTVEFIPSSTHHHNSLEKLGDTVLSLCIVSDIIKALPGQPLYYINHKYNKSISNDFFNAISSQNNFQNCIIGPIDEEKVPADCFEAISGAIFTVNGYKSISNFWKERVFDIDDSFIEKNQLKKTINSMRLNLKNSITDVQPTKSMPPYAKQLFDSYMNSNENNDLIMPAQDAFTQGSEMQQKCKMIGAAFLKMMIAKNVFSRMKKDDDLLIIEMKSKKASVEEVAQKIGFPSSRQIKIFIGGLFLTNSFDDVEKIFNSQLTPQFELFPRRRRRHHHLHSQQQENDQ